MSFVEIGPSSTMEEILHACHSRQMRQQKQSSPVQKNALRVEPAREVRLRPSYPAMPVLPQRTRLQLHP